MSESAPIARFSPLSLAKVFSIYYAFWGFFSGLIYWFVDKDTWYAPLGVWTLFVAAKLDFNFHPQANSGSKIVYTFWMAALFAGSGWVSGLLGAVIYNLCSNYFGLRIEGNTK
jgi:hypothetical protein